MNQELLGAAQAYHDTGLPVIPFILTWNEQKQKYDKDNIGTWKKWQTEPQTDEEFKNLRWTQNGKDANAIGVILGTPAKNGLYLTAIDYDTKPISQLPNETKEQFEVRRIQQFEAIKTGKDLVSEFPTTRIDETINKGLHLLYWAKTKAETDGHFHDTAGLELLGDSICLMAPSTGYKNVGSDVITEIDNTAATFYKILQNHGLIPKSKEQEQADQSERLDKFGFNIGKLIDINRFNLIANDEYQGSHPIHDSTTEKNFTFNIKNNTWYCHRHKRGGGALQFLAMKEGIIKCEDAGKGALRGKKFKDTLMLAVAQKLIDPAILLQDDNQDKEHTILLAKDIMEDYTFVTDKDSNTLYFWLSDEGIYCNQTEQLIMREMVTRLNDNFKARYYKDVYEFILNSAPLIKMNGQNPEMLAVKNGLLNIFTRELTEFSPEIYITSKLDWNYNTDAQAPTFTKFFDSVQPNKVQQRQIQQLVGHCLYRKVITETSLILLGTGENGKSIFLDTIKTFLGANNVCSHSIQQLCYDKFSIAEIRGKLANICADLPHKELMNTGTYKALVSGDPVQIYIKHVQDSQTLEPYTKYLYSANHIPTISNEEDGHAWYRRFIFADFSQTFKGKAKIPRQELLNSLSTPEEMEGILKWALDGLKELKENGEVTDKPTVEEIRKEYRKRSSTTLAYFDAKVKVTDEETDFIFTDIWFRDYVTYCHAHDLTPKSKFQFIQDAETFLPGAFRTKIRPEPIEIHGKLKTQSPIAAWRYVVIKDTAPEVTPEKAQKTLTSTTEPNTVPSVPSVPQFSNLSEINQEFKNCKNSEKTQTNSGNVEQTEQMEQAALGETQLKVVTEDSGLKRLEVEKSSIVNAKRFKPKAGRLCQQPQPDDVQCAKEAEFSINGNLYCPTCFDVEKENLRAQGKVVCAEFVGEVS